jgi:hypothetical protein
VELPGQGGWGGGGEALDKKEEYMEENQGTDPKQARIILLAKGLNLLYTERKIMREGREVAINAKIIRLKYINSPRLYKPA